MPRIRAESIEAHKELVRRRALAEAGRLFRLHGYHGTTLGEVADAVGVGRTTLYEYFEDKEDLLVCFVEENLPAAIDRMLRAIPPHLSPAERLAELAVRMMEFVASEDNLGTLLMREVPKLSSAAQARVMEAHSRQAEELLRIYRTGVRGGEFREVTPELARRFIHEVVFAGARMLLAAQDPKQQVHRLADELVDLLLHGLSRS